MAIPIERFQRSIIHLKHMQTQWSKRIHLTKIINQQYSNFPILPSMMCDLIRFSNLFELLSAANLSKYSFTSVNTSSFGTSTVNDRLAFSNREVKLAFSINDVNMLYCSFDFNFSNKFCVGFSNGRSI